MFKASRQPLEAVEKRVLENATTPAAKSAKIRGELLTTEALKAIIKETAKEDDETRSNFFF